MGWKKAYKFVLKRKSAKTLSMPSLAPVPGWGPDVTPMYHIYLYNVMLDQDNRTEEEIGQDYKAIYTALENRLGTDPELGDLAKLLDKSKNILEKELFLRYACWTHGVVDDDCYHDYSGRDLAMPMWKWPHAGGVRSIHGKEVENRKRLNSHSGKFVVPDQRARRGEFTVSVMTEEFKKKFLKYMKKKAYDGFLSEQKQFWEERQQTVEKLKKKRVLIDVYENDTHLTPYEKQVMLLNNQKIIASLQ